MSGWTFIRMELGNLTGNGFMPRYSNSSQTRVADTREDTPPHHELQQRGGSPFSHNSTHSYLGTEHTRSRSTRKHPHQEWHLRERIDIQF